MEKLLDGLRVLVVDDEPAIHRLLGDILRFLGCSGVEIAANGKEAVERYRNFQPDVVVMDMDMPVMNGFDASREIKTLDPQAAIVIITGFPDSRLASSSLERGLANIVIPKPFEFQQLQMAIREALKIRGASSQIPTKKGAVA
jgi:two-component system chemotaxis response regulator CheY